MDDGDDDKGWCGNDGGLDKNHIALKIYVRNWLSKTQNRLIWELLDVLEKAGHHNLNF